MPEYPDIRDYNYSYFPIFVDEARFGKSRDELYEHLKQNSIHGRRHFYPLISHFAVYRGLESAKADNLPIAEEVSKKVICFLYIPY